MELQLKRTELQPERTFGDFIVDGSRYFHTIEDTVRAPAVKVKGKTAIPPGRYEVILSRSKRFGRVLPEILKVPMFEGIRIHKGNTELDTEGCIILGTQRKGDMVVNSTTAEIWIIHKMREAIARDEKIYLTISNPS